MNKIFFILLLPLFLGSCVTRTMVREPVVVLTPKVSPKKMVAATPIPKPTLVPKKPHKHVVLDAGHGGKDKGTYSDKNHYEEKERTLRTTKIVKGYLEDLGYKVTMTRTTDVFIPLEKRAAIANATDATLFVSIHYNHCESTEVDGIEVFYYKDEKNPLSTRILSSKNLAERVLARIIKHTGASSRGVKKANFAVVRETKMPAILIEAGFLSNPQERDKIKQESYLCYMGWAIAKGIDSYLEKEG